MRLEACNCSFCTVLHRRSYQRTHGTIARRREFQEDGLISHERSSVKASVAKMKPSRRWSRRAGVNFQVTVLDCTPEVRHDNYSDSGVVTMRYRALFCANEVSNSRGDWYPSDECRRSL